MKDPPSTEENREALAEILVNDMSIQELREAVKLQFMSSYKISKRTFLKDYRNYFKETYGHCPFGINSD
tara:strand:+ start:399 stop:605 length:207 start_codon:yes stop_codon:yes gene_type:complete